MRQHVILPNLATAQAAGNVLDGGAVQPWNRVVLMTASQNQQIGTRLLCAGAIMAGGSMTGPVFSSQPRPEHPADFGATPVIASPQMSLFAAPTDRGQVQPASLFFIPTPDSLQVRGERLRRRGRNAPAQLGLYADDNEGSEFFIAVAHGTPICGSGATVIGGLRGHDGRAFCVSAPRGCFDFASLTPDNIARSAMEVPPLRFHLRSLPSRPQQANKRVPYGAPVLLMTKLPGENTLRVLGCRQQTPEVYELLRLDEALHGYKRPDALMRYAPLDGMAGSPSPLEFPGPENTLYANFPNSEYAAQPSALPMFALGGVIQLTQGIQAMPDEVFGMASACVTYLYPQVVNDNGRLFGSPLATPVPCAYQYLPQSYDENTPQVPFYTSGPRI
jgi:hypothetical protein